MAEAPDEPTYCEFKQVLSYATKKEKGELVKDVSAFANADLEALGGFGYIVYGVANDGRVVGVEGLAGDPASETRQIVNGHLDRPVAFEYLTCEVDDKASAAKRVVAIVVPDSKRRPHVVSREIKEQLAGKDKFWLRKGDVWVRHTGGRALATAEDFDILYEGKLRRLIDDQVRPLREWLERVEDDLREQRDAVPVLDFGLADLGGVGPAPSGRPYAIVGNLIHSSRVRNEINRAMKEARATRPQTGYSLASIAPTAKDYERYARALDAWLSEIQELLLIEFVLVNTGRIPAEDVEVVLDVPAQLRPRQELPQRPTEPQSFIVRSAPAIPGIRHLPSKQTSPDSLIGPKISVAGGLGVTKAVWEVGKLYHDRPLFTGSSADDIRGLLISHEDYTEHLAEAGGEIRLDYTLRAANVPDAVSGAITMT